MPGGPMWCELFLILYCTPLFTELKVNKTDACLFNIFTIDQIIQNTVTVAKHLVIFTVLEDSCVEIFAKTTAHRSNSGDYSEKVTGRYFSIVAR